MDKQTEEKFYKFLREGNKVDAYHLLVEERKKQVYLKKEQSKVNCFPKASFNPSQILHFQDEDKDKTTRIAIKNGENKYSFYTLNKKIKQKKTTQETETYYELEPDKQGDSIFSENKERYINYDCNEINAWSRWYRNLGAEILVIGKHFGDLKYFIDNKGYDEKKNSTNKNLKDLFEHIGITLSDYPTVEDIPTTQCNKKLFFTNAILSIPEHKDAYLGIQKKAQSEQEQELYNSFKSDCNLLKKLIELIEPKIIIILGQDALMYIESIYKQDCPYTYIKDTIRNNPIFTINNGETSFFAFYHCGGRGPLNRYYADDNKDLDVEDSKKEKSPKAKGLDLLKKDWEKIIEYL